jgi:hypothetical protein
VYAKLLVWLRLGGVVSERRAHCVLIRVRDSGIGIAAQDVERIWELRREQCCIHTSCSLWVASRQSVSSAHRYSSRRFRFSALMVTVTPLARIPCTRVLPIR